MKLKVFLILFALGFVSLLPVVMNAQQSGTNGKEPYSFSMRALKGVLKTEVFVTITTTDGQRFPLPTSLRSLEADPQDRNNHHLGNYKDHDLPLVQGSGSFTLPGSVDYKRLSLKVRIRPDNWHDVDFDDDCDVILRPDPKVDKVTFPQQVFIETPCAVSLYDGATLLNTISQVDLHSGSTERVTFRGIRITTAGQHSFVLKITNSDPPESDVTNNNYAFTISALLRPDLRVESARAPTPLFVNSPFGINAVVREYNGQSGATATVTLYEGNDKQASPAHITISAGGTSHVAFQNIKEKTPGAHTYTIKISDIDPEEADETNNSYTFSVTVVLRPDLKLDKVTTPQSVSVGIPFSVDALIKEIDGQSAATATVALFEGNTVLVSLPNVAVSAGGSTTVTFPGIIAATKGNHSYTMKISNANPAESDDSNNNSSFSVSAVARPDLRVDNVTAPASTEASTPFNVTASIKEYVGLVGATATVALYEGTTVLGSAQTITVPPGGNVNVVFHGIDAAGSGLHNYMVKISNANPPEADSSNNTWTFTVNIPARPDLRVDQAIAPQLVTANIPFDVQVVVHELTGQSGATATVTLYEGSTPAADSQNVSVQAGGIVTLVFQGIEATTSSVHTYTASVTGANPGESDLTNNQNTGSTSVNQQTPMQTSLSYTYDRQINSTRTTSSSGSTLDSTLVETASVTYTASASGNVVPATPIDAVSWTIATPSGSFDFVSTSNLVRSRGDALTDYYLMTNVNNKGIDFTMMVDRSQGTIQVSIQQRASFTDHFLQVFGNNQETITGLRANVVRPNNSLSVTFSLQSGENSWGGTTSIPVTPLVMVSSSSRVDTTGFDIDSGVWSTSSVFFAHARSAGPGSPSSTAGTQNKQLAANEDQEAPSVPIAFGLQQNYPNPFNPSTTIEFSLAKASHVTLKVYDMLARELATIVTQDYPAGAHKVRWDARSLPSGVYIYRITAGEFVSQRKLMLLK